MDQRSFFEKVQTLDRRWIFLTIALAVIIPFVFDLTLEEYPTPEVRALFEHVKTLPDSSKILFSLDFDPPSDPELKPMAYAIARHLAHLGHKIYFLTLWPVGANEITEVVKNILHPEFPPYFWTKDGRRVNPFRMNQALRKELGFATYGAKKDAFWIKKGFQKQLNPKGYRNGINYVKLGYKSGGQGVINTLVSSFQDCFVTDAEGTPLRKIPMMEHVRKMKDMDLILNISAGTPGLKEWIQFGGDTTGVPVLGGVTAVSAPLLYPYYPKQLKGLLGGLKAAAEYESLLLKEFPHYQKELKSFKALKRMGPQTVAHLVIILFIFIGNMAYFATKSGRTRGPRLKAARR